MTTTLRTAIELLLQMIRDGNSLCIIRRQASEVRAALGPEPTDAEGAIYTEQDGFRVEAADQFGFADFNDDCTEHRCTTTALVAFAKACEHAGLAQARDMLRSHEANYDSGEESDPFISMSAAVSVAADELDKQLAALGAELGPIREAVTERRMTAAGYVRAPEGSNVLWVKPSCGRRGGNCPCQTAAECIEC